MHTLHAERPIRPEAVPSGQPEKENVRRFAVYEKDGGLRLAVEHGDRFIGLFVDEAGYPGDVDVLIANGSDLVAAGQAVPAGSAIDLDSSHLLPPLSRAGKVVCIGLNYRAHSDEAGFELPIYQTVSARFTSSLIGYGVQPFPSRNHPGRVTWANWSR